MVSVPLAGCGAPQTGSGGAAPTTGTAAPDSSGTSDSSGATEAPSGGPAAPDFALPSLEGDMVRLSKYLGKKVILLDFWHTTCHPCIQEMPELVKLKNKYGKQGLVVLGITTDGPDTMAEVTSVVRDNKINFPILLDEETSAQNRYNPKGELPFTVLIDRHGSIVLKRASYQAGDKKSMQSLVDAIEKALAGN